MRPPTLTPEQEAFIRDRIDMFPAAIVALDNWPGPRASRTVVRAAIARMKAGIEPNDAEDLAAHLDQYIGRHGLPSRFHHYEGVTGFITFLRSQKP